MRTLAARMEDRDRFRFVGRAAELAFLDRCLEDDPPASVILIHGPGGIGKSTLLRELARRAETRDYEAFFVEGREVRRKDASEQGFRRMVAPHQTVLLGVARLGAEHLSELDLQMGRRRIECHRIDYGAGGLLAAQRAVVYSELGLAAPILGDGAQRIELEDVHEALRNFRVPHELARSPLAGGETPDERAASVRELLRDAAERAFGDNANEKLLRRVLIRGYLEPVASHEQAAIDLSLSRAAYFRRLRIAAERVAEYLASQG